MLFQSTLTQIFSQLTGIADALNIEEQDRDAIIHDDDDDCVRVLIGEINMGTKHLLRFSHFGEFLGSCIAWGIELEEIERILVFSEILFLF